MESPAGCLHAPQNGKASHSPPFSPATPQPIVTCFGAITKRLQLLIPASQLPLQLSRALLCLLQRRRRVLGAARCRGRGRSGRLGSSQLRAELGHLSGMLLRLLGRCRLLGCQLLEGGLCLSTRLLGC